MSESQALGHCVSSTSLGLAFGPTLRYIKFIPPSSAGPPPLSACLQLSTTTQDRTGLSVALSLP